MKYIFVLTVQLIGNIGFLSFNALSKAPKTTKIAVLCAHILFNAAVLAMFI